MGSAFPQFKGLLCWQKTSTDLVQAVELVPVPTLNGLSLKEMGAEVPMGWEKHHGGRCRTGTATEGTSVGEARQAALQDLWDLEMQYARGSFASCGFPLAAPGHLTKL